MNTQTPEIPQRPNKQSTETADAELTPLVIFEDSNSIQEDEQSKSLPVLSAAELPTIPPRPSISKRPSKTKSQTSLPLMERLPSIPKRPTSKKHPSQSIDETSMNEPELNKTVDLNSHNSGFDLPLFVNSDLKPSDELLISELNDSDGEDINKTPSNSRTKVSLKDDLDNFGSGASDTDSLVFNDDAETMLQEVEDSGTSTQVLESTIKEQPSSLTSGVMNNDEDEQEPAIVRDTNPGLTSTSGAKSSVILETKVDPVLSDLDHQINKKEEEKEDEEEEGEVKLQTKGSKSEQSMLKEESGHITHVKPTIPKRPSRPLSEGQADEPNKSGHKPLRDETKKPPPRPKPLSSKIAAFQTMFESGDLSLLGTKAIPPRPVRKSVVTDPNHSEEPVDSNQNRAKLSEKHKAFAQNLKGMVGHGIPLPGLATPLALAAASKEKNEDNSDPPTKELEPLARPGKGARNRISKSRKLPANLKSAALVEPDESNTLSILNPWVIDLALH